MKSKRKRKPAALRAARAARNASVVHQKPERKQIRIRKCRVCGALLETTAAGMKQHAQQHEHEAQES